MLMKYDSMLFQDRFIRQQLNNMFTGVYAHFAPPPPHQKKEKTHNLAYFKNNWTIFLNLCHLQIPFFIRELMDFLS